MELPVKTRQDLQRFRWLYGDVKVEPDGEAMAAARARCRQVGQRGMTKTGWGTSPLMHLVEHVIGPVDTHLMLADFPRQLEELMG